MKEERTQSSPMAARGQDLGPIGVDRVSERSQTRFSVLSLNIWNLNEPLDSRMDKLIGFLRHSGPDIVALQEVSPILGARLQSEMIADAAHYPYSCYAKSGLWNGREEGLAVLTRRRRVQLSPIELPMAQNDMRRIAQKVRIDMGGHPDSIVVVNTHLAYRASDTQGRLAQVQELITNLARDQVGHQQPLVLCGDLNDSPESEPIRRLFGDKHLRLTDAWHVNGHAAGWTLASKNPWARAELVPDRRIDYIGVSDSLTIDRCSLVLTGADGWGPVSDHYGVLATIAQNPTGPGY